MHIVSMVFKLKQHKTKAGICTTRGSHTITAEYTNLLSQYKRKRNSSAIQLQKIKLHMKNYNISCSTCSHCDKVWTTEMKGTSFCETSLTQKHTMISCVLMTTPTTKCLLRQCTWEPCLQCKPTMVAFKPFF